MFFLIVKLFFFYQVIGGEPIKQHGAEYSEISHEPNFNTPGVFQITPPVVHGEGPSWDGRKNLLYFVDISEGKVLSYNYSSRQLHSITLNGQVSPVIPAKNNENILLVGVNRTLVAVEWDGEKELGNQRVLTTVAPQFPNSRFNDGKADKAGRLWIGTIDSGSDNHGIFYKIEKSDVTNPAVMLAPVNNSNGLAWNRANNKMYYIDTPTLQVAEYDYDEVKGEISNKRIAVDITKFPTLTGFPDGMTIDVDDNLWIALYSGGAVIKANPKTGQLLQVVPIPARDVTSVAWGGPNYDILFVTTSRRDLDEVQRKQWPAAGSSFAVTNLETKGLPSFYADLVDSVKRNLLANLLLTTNELLSPTNSNESNGAQKVNIQKKHTSSEEFLESTNNDKPLWMTMLQRIRNFIGQ